MAHVAAGAWGRVLVAQAGYGTSLTVLEVLGTDEGTAGSGHRGVRHVITSLTVLWKWDLTVSIDVHRSSDGGYLQGTA